MSKIGLHVRGNVAWGGGGVGGKHACEVCELWCIFVDVGL